MLRGGLILHSEQAKLCRFKTAHTVKEETVYDKEETVYDKEKIVHGKIIYGKPR